MKIELVPFETSKGEEIPQKRVIVERILPNGAIERRQQAWYMDENKSLILLGDCTIPKRDRAELQKLIEDAGNQVSVMKAPPTIPTKEELAAATSGRK